MKTKNKLIKKFAMALLSLISIGAFSQSATYINKVFQDLSGSPVFNPVLNPLGLQWSNSIISANGHLITVGHTFVSGQGENLYLKRLDRQGNVVFQTDFNTSGTQNDYGIALAEASNGDIVVCGTTDNGTTSNYDILLIRFDANGSLLNTTTYAAPLGLNDVATCLRIDGSGDIYIGASSQSSATNYDYLLLKYNSGFNISWTNTYDFAGMTEVPTGIDFGAGTDVYITGASQSSLINWDYAVARYNSTNGIYISDVRNNIPGTGIDHPFASKKDASNNIYFTGKSWSGNNYNIKTVKITPAYAIAWTATLDVSGNDDVGTTLDVDVSGNVYVGGYATNTSNKRELICVKYNSSGNLKWQYSLPATNQAGDAYIQKLTVNSSNNQVYYVAGELGNNGFINTVVGKIKSNGERNWYQVVADPTKDILPSDITTEANTIFAISILDPTNAKYQTTGFSELVIDTASVYKNNKPERMKNHLLVTLQPNAIVAAKINNKNLTHGTIADFITPNALITLVETTGIAEIGTYQAYKVLPWMVMDDSMSVTRSGRLIKMFPHYTTFGIIVPNTIQDSLALHKFRIVPNVVRSVQYNRYVFLTATANDPHYSNGNSAGLTTTTLFPDANVNIEPAWDLSTGNSGIKVGIYDTGINFSHPDFGNGTFSGSKIIGGYNYQANVPLSTTASNDVMGHGTACADKIGALRNNNIAIAGIAGGDGQGNTGVSIYDMKIFGQGADCLFNRSTFASEAVVYNAIVQGATNNTLTGSGFGQHIQNHSYEGLLMYSLVQRGFNTAFENEVMLCVPSGNDGVIYDCQNYSYPASYKDHMVTKVGGNYESGDRVGFSECGHRLDLIAPAVHRLYSSLTRTGTAVTDSLYWPAANSINCFYDIDGTSFASPHVAGAAALLLSYSNNTFMPNSLYPEDMEHLLELAATDLTVSPNYPGYDSIAGYGRLNIGQALNNYYYPGYLVQHYTFNVSASSAYSVGAIFENTCLWESKFGQPFGLAKVRRYKITGTNSHTIPAGYTFITGWERNAGSNLMGINTNTLGLSGPAINCLTASVLFEEDRYIPDAPQILPVSITSTSASFDGYLYEIYDPNTNTPVGWYPFAPNTGTATFAYSLYLKSNSVGLKEENFTENSFYMYPNPTMDKIYFRSRIKDIERVDVSVFSSLGQLVLTQENLYIGETNSIDVSRLNNGIYFAKVRYGNKTIVNKIIVAK